ncbi:MAG: DUF4493 domain-containing protein [Bacteroidales bacterium]|nr:DUF4493 domain-containing protein [Bacteroidales bacterium]
MKTMKSFMGLLALLVAFSCTKNTVTSGGYVSFAVSADEVLADVTKSNVSDYATVPTAAAFTLEITDASGGVFWNGNLSDWDPATMIPVGEYTAKAIYGDLEDEGFDKPFFEGSQTFAVKGAETTPVAVSVALGNTVVKVNCTDNFKNYYPDHTFKLMRGISEIVTFAKDDTRAAFIDGWQVQIKGTLMTETGAEKVFSAEYKNLNPATAYTLVLDIANTGSGAVALSFNNDVQTVEVEEVELND